VRSVDASDGGVRAAAAATSKTRQTTAYNEQLDVIVTQWASSTHHSVHSAAATASTHCYVLASCIVPSRRRNSTLAERDVAHATAVATAL